MHILILIHKDCELGKADEGMVFFHCFTVLALINSVRHNVIRYVLLWLL